MISGIFRFLSGTVTVSLKGKHIEKFINQCIKENVYIWNIKYNNIDNISYFTTSHIYYMQLRNIAKKTNCTIRVINKKGIPFFLHKNREKMGIIIGVIPFFIMLYFLSMFVWNIEITGINTINSYDILDKLEEYGIYQGALMKNIDTQSVKRQSFSTISELSWIAVNKEGSNIVIELTERDIEPELIDKTIVTNLKAACDGQIVSMNIRKGNKEVAIGDAVIKGQLLVSGIIDSELTNTVRVTRADGEIFAKTKHSLNATVLLQNKIYVPTGNYISKKELNIFTIKFPITISKNPDFKTKIKTNTKYLLLNQNTLPISIKEDKYEEYIEKEITFDIQKANDVALQKLSLLEAFAYNNIKVDKKELKITETPLGITITADYSCIENIVEEIEIPIKQNTD